MLNKHELIPPSPLFSVKQLVLDVKQQPLVPPPPLAPRAKVKGQPKAPVILTCLLITQVQMDLVKSGKSEIHVQLPHPTCHPHTPVNLRFLTASTHRLSGLFSPSFALLKLTLRSFIHSTVWVSGNPPPSTSICTRIRLFSENRLFSESKILHIEQWENILHFKGMFKGTLFWSPGNKACNYMPTGVSQHHNAFLNHSAANYFPNGDCPSNCYPQERNPPKS